MAFEEIEKLKDRLAKDPSSKLFVPLAEEYRKAGMFDEAIEVLRNGLEKQPSYMSARVSLGKIYLEKEMVEEAKAEFEQVVKAIPDNLFAHKKLAEIYKDLGDPIKAVQQYEVVLKLNPLDEDAKLNLESLAGGVDENITGTDAADGKVPEEPAKAAPVPEPPPAPPEPVPEEPAKAAPVPEPPPAPPEPAPEEPAKAAPVPEPPPAPPEPVPVEMSWSGEDNDDKLGDMLMHEEIKAEAAEMGADLHKFTESFTSDLREKGPAFEKPKDDTPMYYTDEEPGAPQPETREIPGEMHPFARFESGKEPLKPASSFTQELPSQDPEDVTTNDEQEIPEVSISEKELDDIEGSYTGKFESGFSSNEEEEVSEISISEDELKEAGFTDEQDVFSPPAEPVPPVVMEEPPAMQEIPTRVSVPQDSPGPESEEAILQGLRRAESFIDSGDMVQAVQYYDMLLGRFPGEKRILQKLEELKTYLKMTGKGQEMIIQRMEILLKGIQKRKNEFFGSA